MTYINPPSPVSNPKLFLDISPTPFIINQMADIEGNGQRKRARQACISCNARRVKCDVTEKQPCSNCEGANTVCETRESRRGKHPRPSKRQRAESDATSTLTTGTQHGQQSDEVAASHVLASLRGRDSTANQDATVFTATHGVLDPDHFVSPRHDAKEDEVDVFLGESSLLRYVTDATHSTSGMLSTAPVRLRHAVPDSIRAEALVPQWELDRRATRLQYLRTDGAFHLPPGPVVEKLMKAYFRWFHPCFAIVDEIDIWTQYRGGLLSSLLLQSILFIGILHCDESVLNELGFDSRHRAKYRFYNRAKDIYDAEIERKKVTVIQSLFLMSFWRAGALLEKDTRHWLGCAISLAQTKALHRSAGKIESQDAKMRKRLWWSLYTRDRQCAAALGLPNRVRDEDCDFEMLEHSDFELAFNLAIPQDEVDEYIHYQITITELAKVLGDVVHAAYLPNKPLQNSHKAQMREDLMRLKAEYLPKAVDGTLYPRTGYFANMQHLAFNNLIILLHRHDYLHSEEPGREAERNLVLQTAADQSRIIEDMLAEGNLRHGQIHVITNVFNTLCIHTVHLRRSDGTAQSVAEHRAKLCLLGLQELQKTWEVTNWVLQLFFQYLDRSTASRLRMQDDEHLVNTGSVPSKQATPQTQPAGYFAAPSRLPNGIPEGDLMPGPPDPAHPTGTPWTWTSDEASQFLFSHIEDDFGFGEGEMLDWSPEDQAAMQISAFYSQPDMDPNIHGMPHFSQHGA